MSNYKRHKPRKLVRCAICSPRGMGRDTMATRSARQVLRELRQAGYRIHGR